MEPFVAQRICVWRDNLRVCAQARCETRACIDQGDCMPSYNNSSICQRFKLGVSQRELIFRLGQPRREGQTLFFAPSPTAREIRITLNQNGDAEVLDCGR